MRIFLTILISTLSVLNIFAQWDSNLSQYWNMKNFYNPSFIGQTNVIEASLLQRNQWVGVRNPPVTSVLSLNMPLRFLEKDHGVGFLMLRDKAGLFKSTAFIGQYNLKMRIKQNYVLNIGIMGGEYTNDFDTGGIYIPQPESEEGESNSENTNSSGDSAIPAINANSKVIDGGLGVSLITPNYYIGISVNHLLSPKISFIEDSQRRINRTYYLVGGYNISTISSSIALYPSVFYRTNTITHQFDLTLRGEYKKFINAGISWRKDDGLILSLGLRIKYIDAGYSYDLSTSAMGKVSNGSHEIYLRYKMSLSNPKRKEPLKSIRIL